MKSTSQETQPAPDNKQCFNCGEDLGTHVTFCPHCGAPLPTQGSGVTIALRIIGIMILIGLALVLGAAGACCMVVAGIGGVSPDLGGNPNVTPLGYGLIGLALLSCTALCIWGAIAIRKWRK